MIKKLILTLTLLFTINNCSVDSLLALGKVNKVKLVKHNRYTKEYRAYFTRDDLRYIKKGRKYLYYYNSRKKDLVILLHPKGEYIAYSITHPPKKVLQLASSRRVGYRYVNRLLKKHRYYQVSPSKYGYKANIYKRIFKGIKTYYLRVIDYNNLIYTYKKAIKSYNYAKVKNIRTKLPLAYIKPYYNRYKNSAKTASQKSQIKQIGIKLGIIKSQTTKPTKQTIDTKQEEDIQDTQPTPMEEETIQAKPIEDTKPIEDNKPTGDELFDRYIHTKSYTKLHKFMQTKEAKDKLSYAQFSRLTYLEAKLKEQELLKHGSIEELIAEYKKTNNPRYKSRAMELMKNSKNNL